MQLHDWIRVPVGLFHHFHQDWFIELTRELNRGRLPKSVLALVEQRAGPREPDVLAIDGWGRYTQPGSEGNDGVATLAPPTTRIVRRSAIGSYAARANRIVTRHHLGRILAVIEIVSPGDKHTRAAVRDFVEKTVSLLKAGIHVLVIDLFPPSPRDPYGIHKAIWDDIVEEDFQLPSDKDRILVSYKAGYEVEAYVEPAGLDDNLPDMPLFLSDALHITVPLTTTYEATWQATPEDLRTAVETGVLPDPEAE